MRFETEPIESRPQNCSNAPRKPGVLPSQLSLNTLGEARWGRSLTPIFRLFIEPVSS